MSAGRAAAAWALVVLGLQLAVAARPAWERVGPWQGIPRAAWALDPRLAWDGDALVLRCPPELPSCRAEAVVALPGRSGPVVARAEASRGGGLRSRLVLVDVGRRPVAVAAERSEVVTASPGAEGLTLVVSLAGDGERARLQGVEVADGRRSPLRVALLTAWWIAVGGLVVATTRAAATLDRAAWRSLAALAPLVLVGITMPSALVDRVLLSLPGARPEDLGADLFTAPTLPVVVQKVVGHGLSFAALGFVLTRGRARAVNVVATVVWLAVLTETLQRLLPDRSGKVADVLVDVVGGLLGAVVGRRLRP